MPLWIFPPKTNWTTMKLHGQNTSRKKWFNASKNPMAVNDIIHWKNQLRWQVKNNKDLQMSSSNPLWCWRIQPNFHCTQCGYGNAFKQRFAKTKRKYFLSWRIPYLKDQLWTRKHNLYYKSVSTVRDTGVHFGMGLSAPSNESANNWMLPFLEYWSIQTQIQKQANANGIYPKKPNKMKPTKYSRIKS